MGDILLFLCGLAGGVLGGMGMGGGTALIPLLTLVCGVGQAAAQGVNLVCFLPMAFGALAVHSKSGLLEKRGLWAIVLPALLFSLLSSFAAAMLPARALSRGFGALLVILSLFTARSALPKFSKKSSKMG